MGVVVVGAGHAGLAVSWHLSRQGIDHQVLERGRIGESWWSGRWDSFRLNSPSWFNVLPGESGPAGPRDDFLGRDAWAGHLAAYARACGLPVREATPVVALERAADGRAFLLCVGDRREEAIEARAVVVASGMQRVPRMPALAKIRSRMP